MRTYLALLLVSCAVLPAGVVADDAEDQAVAAVEALGGKVERDPMREGAPVIAATLRSRKVCDDDLKRLQGLSALELLDLGNTGITDDGLANLGNFQKLKSLKLSFTRITDKGLVHLEGFQELEYLHVGYTRVTKDGKSKLQQALPRLKIEGP